MKISKLFHFLYASVMALPLLAIPIFAVYSNNQNASFDMSIAQEESKYVNFNQLADVLFPRNSYGLTFLCTNNGDIVIDGTTTSANNKQLLRVNNVNHIYLLKSSFEMPVGSSFGTYYVSSYRQYYRGSPMFSDYFYFGFNNGVSFNNFSTTINCFDLTLMFGAGNEPTIEQFNTWFNGTYPYSVSEQYFLDNYTSTTYNDTDIASQYVYSLYNTIDKYFNFDNVFNFGDLYSWLQETFFSGTAPLGFFIFWHYLTYWLLISLIWLIFDVLMYVPNLVHSWLDKGAIE